ncbi:hypothetical protein NQ317_012217 [Molorchus minor]|uniref:Uncharacterized protein n=1 Tax=Molorchus minor TaxID=1323400 RepID=A0ABQ9IRU5_9CUCU|nr:hypothetical protein NQ317_012217 [Molorchus minor]
MKVVFENGDNYTLGTENAEVVRVDFDWALLNQLEVFGSGAIDQLVLYFSDGRRVTVGERSDVHRSTVFELNDHHIVGIFLSSDVWSLGGQAANISVAYKSIDNLSCLQFGLRSYDSQNLVRRK